MFSLCELNIYLVYIYFDILVFSRLGIKCYA